MLVPRLSCLSFAHALLWAYPFESMDAEYDLDRVGGHQKGRACYICNGTFSPFLSIGTVVPPNKKNRGVPPIPASSTNREPQKKATATDS